MIALVLLTGFAREAAAKPPKPEKFKVAFGTWTGPSTGSFKSALRSALAKDCSFVGRKSARLIFEGVVAPQGKGAVLSFTIKLARNDEIVESREFKCPRPTPNRAQANKFARAIVEMARRAPPE